MALAICENVDIGKVFGARLKQCRKALRLKQEAVGHAVEYSKSMISEIENGKQTPPLEKAVAFARFFGVSGDALINEEHHEYQTPWLSLLRDMAMALPNEHKLTIAELLKAMARELETACQN